MPVTTTVVLNTQPVLDELTALTSLMEIILAEVIDEGRALPPLSDLMLSAVALWEGRLVAVGLVDGVICPVVTEEGIRSMVAHLMIPWTPTTPTEPPPPAWVGGCLPAPRTHR